MIRNALVLCIPVLLLAVVLSRETTKAWVPGLPTPVTVAGITADEIPLSWKYSIALQGNQFVQTAPGVFEYLIQAPPGHGLLILKTSLRRNATVRYISNGVTIRYQQWKREGSSLGPMVLVEGHDGNLLVRPGEVVTVEIDVTQAQPDFMNLDVAFIPASQLPNVPGL